MRRSRLAVGLGLVGLAGAASAGLVVPRRTAAVAASGRDVLVAGLREVPVPVLVAVVLLLAVVLWFVAVRYALSILYRVWRRVSDRVYWALTLVLPESPLVRFAAGTMVLIALVIVVVGGLPVLIGDLADSDEGAAGYVNRMNGELVNAEWEEIVDGDAVREEPACSGTGSPAEPDATDRDGDGLPDAWERAGETPGGAALPDADPGRKDLYVQVNYGSDVEALTDAERRQLRETWAAMPVENPDGSTGIAIHVDDESADAGDLGEPASIGTLADRDAWYTAERLGPRRCIYRQTVYGKVDVDGVAGVASSPGYSSAVDGARQPAYDGTVSFRVALTNHELLHTVAGYVDGGPHTEEGWLAGGSSDEFLSAATAAELNATGIHGPAG